MSWCGVRVEQRVAYQGEGLGLVDGKDRFAIPAPLRAALAGNSPREDGRDGGTIIIGVHPAYRCLRAYDPAYVRELRADEDRRDAFDLEKGLAPDYDRKRRAASGEAVPFDGSGRFGMPGFPRHFANISDKAFFYGMLDWIEIWDPRTALEANVAGVLKDACRYHCDLKGITP